MYKSQSVQYMYLKHHRKLTSNFCFATKQHNIESQNPRTAQVGRHLNRPSVQPSMEKEAQMRLSITLGKSLQQWGFHCATGEVVPVTECSHYKRIPSLYQDEASTTIMQKAEQLKSFYLPCTSHSTSTAKQKAQGAKDIQLPVSGNAEKI